MPRRLPARNGEWIDRSQTLEFEFEGKRYTGHPGDTLSSALLANGVSLLGRSFKYHRPRSVYSFANHDINVMMESKDKTHIRADVIPLADGLSLRSCNTSGGLKFDRAQMLQWLAPLLPVGFYYKAFHSPKALFPYWERLIRRLAGLGHIDSQWPRETQNKHYLHCDVLVIGAGPSGLAAALAAREQGAEVILVDEGAQPGGSLNLYHPEESSAQQLLARAQQALTEDAGLHWFGSSYIAGAYADRWLALVNADGLTKVRARRVVVATGVFEQPAVFHNNDLPGVMLMSAALRLLQQHSIAACDRAVILAANDEAYRAAVILQQAGIVIAAIADLRPSATLPPEAEALKQAGVDIYRQYTVYAAHAKGQRVGSVSLCPLDENKQPNEQMKFEIECDGLLMSVGWAPAAALLYQAGARLAYNETLEQLLPLNLPEGYYACGRLAGVYDLAARITHGDHCGRQAARGEAVEPANIDAIAHSHPYPIFDHPQGKNFVDLDEDLQLKDLINATREGFDNIELLKRFSTVGMGPSQGKHANMNNIRILARRLGQTIDETGSTTARPFFHPVELGKLAGRRLRPQRKTALYAQHQDHAAVWMETGHWLRPKYYGQEKEQTAIAAEVAAVHNSVGIIDVSTLGKISVVGEDAVELLERLYTMGYSKLAVGATRYALMVDEAGVIIDDGIVARLDETVFYVTTTSSGAASVYREMQRRTIEWGLKVELVNLTSQMAAINLAGPESARVLARLTDLDLTQEAFPFLALRQTSVAGMDCLLMRVGFVGELGYEIHLPAQRAHQLWQLLMEAGRAAGIRPFGVEAQRLLRLQKGHIIVSQDSDGTSSPYDANMGWAIRNAKPFFIGKRSLAILADKHLYTLVGFQLPRRDAVKVAECNLIIEDDEIIGRVTSIGNSEKLDQGIGLAMIKKAYGESSELSIRLSNGRMLKVSVCTTPFYDPDNQQQKTTIDLNGITPLRYELTPPRSPAHVESRVKANDWLRDLSCKPLYLLKGVDAETCLRELELPIPEALFATVSLDGEGFVSRTGAQEFLLFAGHSATLAQALSSELGMGATLSVYERGDLHIVLPAIHSAKLFAELCALPTLTNTEQLTYTLVAQISCWILPRQGSDGLEYHIGCDPSYGPYLFNTLNTLIRESSNA